MPWYGTVALAIVAAVGGFVAGLLIERRKFRNALFQEVLKGQLKALSDAEALAGQLVNRLEIKAVVGDGEQVMFAILGAADPEEIRRKSKELREVSGTLRRFAQLSDRLDEIATTALRALEDTDDRYQGTPTYASGIESRKRLSGLFAEVLRLKDETVSMIPGSAN